jgi:translation initiation factor 4A
VTLSLGDFMGVTCHACVGGTSIRDEIPKLKGAQIVIGTPGRVSDMITRKFLSRSFWIIKKFE